VIVLATGGFFLISTLPVNLTYKQLVAPISPGTVSSLLMGGAWGTAGLAVPLIGLIADHVGLAAALSFTALLPLGAALLAWPLPPVARARRPFALGEGMIPPAGVTADDVVR
jgi:hypothetical protein